MAISHCYWWMITLWLSEWQISHILTYWHLHIATVVKNGNFTLLLTSSGQEWQFQLWTRLAIGRSASRSTPPNVSLDIYYGMYLTAILHSSRKMWEIYFYFWIIRVVNCQLALYSHVRGKPHLTPPETPMKHPQNMTITNFNYESSYLPGVICNIVVKADLGRSPGTFFPPVLMSSGQEWQFHIATDM